ncbi:hypothetical protein [Acholeplasma oculi]|nr:hypothetical protein [Acholeplasma oculi]
MIMKASYGWLLKWILAAILIGVGFTMFFSKELVFLITGIVIIVFSLFRVVPLVKSLKKEILRTINIVEIVLDFILGGILTYVGVEALQSGIQPDSIWSMAYKYILVFILLSRAIIYLYSVVFLDEKTEQIKFWSHIGIFALGAAIIGIENFNEEWIAWLLLIISLFGGAYLIYDGSKGYGNYRKYSLSINQQKEVTKDSKIEKDLPKSDQPVAEKDDDRPFVS